MNILLMTLTLFSAGFVISYTLYIAFLLYAFTELTPRQQAVAKIKLGPLPFLSFLFSVAFLIARVFS